MEHQEDESPILSFIRATVYTWWKPAKRSSLGQILFDTLSDKKYRKEIEEKTGADPDDFMYGKDAFEEEQVESKESKGLGFYWVDVSVSTSRGVLLLTAEERIRVVNLHVWEQTHVGLGYEYLQTLRRVLGNAARMLWGEGA